MRTLLLTMSAVVLLPLSVLAGNARNCPPQPACQTAPAAVQCECRTILPYHVALQRADVADQLEVQTRQQAAEIEQLKSELLAAQQERDSFHKQVEQQKALAVTARQESEAALAKLRNALDESRKAHKEAEEAHAKATESLKVTKENLEQAEAALAVERNDLAKVKQEGDLARTQVQELKAVVADLKAKLDQAEKEAPQKAPKPGQTQPAKTEEPLKVEDDSNSNNQDKPNQ